LRTTQVHRRRARPSKHVRSDDTPDDTTDASAPVLGRGLGRSLSGFACLRGRRSFLVATHLVAEEDRAELAEEGVALVAGVAALVAEQEAAVAHLVAVAQQALQTGRAVRVGDAGIVQARALVAGAAQLVAELALGLAAA